MSKLLKVEDAINKINEICLKNDLNFLGFCDKDGNDCEWYGNMTKLVLRCAKCNKIWKKTNYNSFTVRHLGCPFCTIKKKRTDKKDFKALVLKKCHEKEYTFIEFCDRNGNVITEPLKATTTYLHLRCLKCGNEWKTTTYNGLVNCAQGCPNCKIQNIIEQTRWQEDDIVRTINEKCKEKNYDFLGFCDKDGNDCEFGKIKNTFLHLKCNICGTTWKSTNIDTFIRNKNGCPQCKILKIGQIHRLDKELVLKRLIQKCDEQEFEFLGFCNKNGEYCDYQNNSVKLHLKCKKCDYEWKSTSYYHLTQRGVCCPSCTSWSLEDEIAKLFISKHINHIRQKRFDWLGQLSLDFYLPQYNIAIECQGLQHFKPIKFYGGEEEYIKRIERDERKRKLCEEHGIKLLYYSNLHIDYPYKVYEDKEELLKEILETF